VNPTGTQIIPKYYTVKWTKLNRNYNDAWCD
jgi:hypothetical protein